MKTLERLVWAKEVSISVFGVEVVLRATFQSAVEKAIEQLPAARVITTCSSRRKYSIIVSPPPRWPHQRYFHFLFSNTRCLARSTNWCDLWEALESDVSTYVALTAPKWLFVHAGVVGWKDYAIIVPGHSFSGKTTLVEKLIQRGASYYSDEFAIFDPNGFVHPFARPLSIRSEANSRPIRIKAESLGAEVGSKPLPIKLIIATRYEKSARWRPKAVSSGNGVLLLLSHTLAARSRPNVAMDILYKAVSGAQVLRGPRGQAEEVVDAIIGK
jgi:hypothetical protein